MSKPNFRPINTRDISDDDIARISDTMNVPALVRDPAAVTPSSRPESTPPRRQAVSPSKRAAGEPSQQRKLTIRIPADLTDTLKRDAIDKRTTVRTIVLTALKAAGYTVSDADLAPGAGGNA